VELPEAVATWRESDEITIEPAAGVIQVGDRSFQVPPLPEMLLAIRDAGGLLPAVRARLEIERRTENHD
jgi:hypothetical protein